MIFFVVAWILIIFLAIDYWFLYDSCIMAGSSADIGGKNETLNTVFGLGFQLLAIATVTFFIAVLGLPACGHGFDLAASYFGFS
jgi:hypothetical protein